MLCIIIIIIIIINIIIIIIISATSNANISNWTKLDYIEFNFAAWNALIIM